MTTSGASHTLTFSKLRAHFTVDKEIIGKQDPYIIFQSGNSKVQTKAIKGVGADTAEWKESYTLEKFSPGASSYIEVTVYNHNTLLPDSVIGSGKVDLSRQGSDSLSGSGGPLSVVLTDKKGQEVGTLSFVTNGGGYSGSGRSGVGSGVGTGSGVGSGVGSGTSGSSVVGRGAGTDQRTAQAASDAAAAKGHDVTIENRSGVGIGHPVGGTSGVGSGMTSGSHTGTGSHSHTGTGSHTTGSTGQKSTMGEKVAGFIPGTEENKDKKAGYAPGQGPEHTRGNVTAGEKAASFIPGTKENQDKKAGFGGTTGTHTGTGYGTTGATSGVTGSSITNERAYGTKEGEVIDQKYYVGKEERAQDQALIEQYREHNPYAKDYETTVQHTGRERLVGSNIEALGTRERVIGQDHHVQTHPHQEIARNLPAGALETRPGGEGWVQTKPGPICDTNTFSITGDRMVDKERVTDLREHREFEKEFEVKTRLVGERELAQGKEAEILNRERVLVDEKSKNACEGHPSAGGSTGTGSYGATTTGTGTSGYGTSGTTGTGTGYGTTGTTGTGTGYGTSGTTGTGTGYGTSGTTGTTGHKSLGEKAAAVIPGSQENKQKKAGLA